MDRAIIYARVSTDEQAEKHSLPSQIEACREYCASRGYVIVREVQEDYSGTSATRPELSQILDAPEIYDVLVVFSLDRFARKLAVQVLLEKEINEQGKRIEYVRGGSEDTPEGRLSQQIQAVIAEFEVEQLKSRTTRGHYGRAKSGKVQPGRTALLGYDYVDDRYVVNEEEAELVRQIFEWYTVEKVGIQVIARRLTEKKIPTKWDRAGLTRKKKPGVWGVSTVHYILNNQAYTGTWTYGENGRMTAVDVEIPPIIQEKTYREARQQASKNTRTAKRNTKGRYLFRRRMTCAKCGMKFNAASGRYRCYGTWSRNSTDYEAPICSGTLEAAEADKIMWRGVKDILLKPELVQKGWEERAPEQDLVGKLEEQVEALADKRERLIELYADKLIPKQSLDKQVSDINAKLTRTQEQLDEINRQHPQPTQDQMNSAADLMKKLSVGISKLEHKDKERIIKILDARAIHHGDMKFAVYLSIDGLEYSHLLS